MTVVWATVLAMDDGEFLSITVEDGGSCGWGARLQCSMSRLEYGVSMGTYACVAAYFILYFWLLRRGRLQLQAVAYQKYRMANLLHRLQVRQAAADLRRVRAPVRCR